MLLYGQYARKSDDDKSVTEKSIGDQLSDLKLIIERDNLSVVKTWKESSSAKTPGKRPFYDEMVKLIEEGKINAIICWHINRLARNMKEGGEIAQLLIDGKIQEIRTLNGVYKPGDNIIPLVVETASATQFSLDHTIVVTRGMKSKFAKGGCNYKAPQGYYNARHPLNLKVGIIERDPTRYDLIRKAWDMFLTGAYTPVQVIETLNIVWGYRTRPTKKIPSRPLGRNYGYHLFSQPYYAGFVREQGNLVSIPDFEPMVTMDEFQKAQELLAKHDPKQARYTHSYPYTGLMICGYCGQQITGEKRLISTEEIWENYHCADSYKKCTKKGIARKDVQDAIISKLNSITIDEELCKIALDNIVRELDSQTQPIQSLYKQQGNTLAEIEESLSNLADMWIQGLMKDRKLYQEKETELTTKRNELLVNANSARNELETMRANAMAASNYIVFARDNFMVADDERKREIAHALGVKYTFYGREKKIEVDIDPLLIETVKFSEEAQKSLALTEIDYSTGYTKEKTGLLQPVLSFGGP